MSTVNIRIRMQDDQDLEAAQNLAVQYSDVEFKATSGTPPDGVAGLIEPITAVLIGAGVALVAKFLVDWWERGRGGLVIDQRPSAQDQAYRDPNVPYGYVIIFPADGGTVKLKTLDTPKDAIHQLLESVIGGTLTSYTDIVKTAGKSLGDSKV